MSGQVMHFEIPADDVKRAAEFYQSAFGWELTELPGMGYTLVRTTPSDDQGMPTTAGAINGGMFERTEPLTTPVIIVDVEDIDAALEAVSRNGGSTVRERTEVGDLGFVAYFRDPEGNLLGLWQNG